MAVIVAVVAVVVDQLVLWSLMLLLSWMAALVVISACGGQVTVIDNAVVVDVNV